MDFSLFHSISISLSVDFYHRNYCHAYTHTHSPAHQQYIAMNRKMIFYKFFFGKFVGCCYVFRDVLLLLFIFVSSFHFDLLICVWTCANCAPFYCIYHMSMSIWINPFWIRLILQYLFSFISILNVSNCHPIEMLCIDIEAKYLGTDTTYTIFF